MLDGKNIHVVDVDDNDFRELQKKEENEENNDGSSSNSRVRQHVTRFVNGKILTERVIRGKDEFPTTARELNANSVEEAEAKAKEETRLIRRKVTRRLKPVITAPQSRTTSFRCKIPS